VPNPAEIQGGKKKSKEKGGGRGRPRDHTVKHAEAQRQERTKKAPLVRPNKGLGLGGLHVRKKNRGGKGPKKGEGLHKGGGGLQPFINGGKRGGRGGESGRKRKISKAKVPSSKPSVIKGKKFAEGR